MGCAQRKLKMADENNDGQAGSSGSDDARSKLSAITQAAEAEAAAAALAAETRAEELKAQSSDANNKDSEMIAKLVQERLDKELATIKKSLDGAYKQRDESLAKIAAFEAKEREANLKRLQDEGKHKEAYELQLAEERAKNDALSKRNTELSRDVNVRDALRSFTFRNDKAADMAFKEITSNLVQDANKQWIHRSGVSIREYCEAFSKDEDQSFLFKAKANSGSGTSSSTSGSGTPSDNGKPKSLFAMSQADVLKLAAEGKLPRQRA
jgi:hypothetical protein